MSLSFESVVVKVSCELRECLGKADKGSHQQTYPTKLGARLSMRPKPNFGMQLF